jgi:signal transduction histidine kinase
MPNPGTGGRSLRAGALAQASRRAAAVSAVLLPCTAALEAAHAQAAPELTGSLLESTRAVTGAFSEAVDAGDILTICIMLGTVAFALLAALAASRARARAVESEARSREELAQLRQHLDRAETLLGADGAAVLAWDAFGAMAAAGHLPGIASGARDVGRLQDFGLWLDPESAARLKDAVEKLRIEARPFNMIVHTPERVPIEADGRAGRGLALLRLRLLLGERARASELAQRHDAARAEAEGFRRLADALPLPIWKSDADGLAWANPAYARAANGGAAPGAQRIAGAPDHAALVLAAEKAGDRPARLPVPAREGAETVAAAAGGNAVVAALLERSGEARLEEALERQRAEHNHVLDQVGSAVAVFDANQRLKFRNAGFRRLFEMADGVLRDGMSHSELLDRMREAHMVPVEPDYRAWKARHLAVYGTPKPQSEQWYLPDGRWLRVVADPHPSGGLTCLFEDQTERIRLESRYNALQRVQVETLRYMREGVAVFGSDGRLDYANPAFAALWGLDPAQLDAQPHIEAIAARLDKECVETGVWTALRHAVTDVADRRASISGRVALADGRSFDYATVPLPDGATLLTTVDVSHAAQMERALRERNEALETAARLKNDFIQHVSYELRTPLTSVIGFTELLATPLFGTLAPKQAEYVEHIRSASGSLLAAVDNILDLATIDAGVLSLDMRQVDIQDLVETAADDTREQREAAGVSLDVDVPEDIGRFIGDPRRLAQILGNLLSNAIGFSPRGASVALKCRRMAEGIEFRVIDRGRGIAPEDLERIFDRFVSEPYGTGHRGAGLGLSIVKSLVELHGGAVEIVSAPNAGTEVVCRLPAVPVAPTLSLKQA